jgi:hypothetical protein
MAEELCIAEVTVKFHLGNIYEKLRIRHLSQVERNLQMPMYCAALSHLSPKDVPQLDQAPEPEILESASLVPVLEDELALTERRLSVYEQGAIQPWKPSMPPPNAQDNQVFVRARRRAVRNALIVFVTIAVVGGLVGAGIMALFLRPSISAREVVTPTALAKAQEQSSELAASPTDTATPRPSPTPTNTPPNATPTPTDSSVCGETAQVEPAGASWFMRDQGVSAFTESNTKGGILNNYVRALTIDDRGLWFGYFATDQNASGGLGHYDKSHWFDCDHAGATVGDVNAVATDHMGRIWVATAKDGVAMFDGQQWHRFSALGDLPSDWTYGITIDEDNNVWVATWEGVAKFDGNSWSVPYNASNDTLFNNHVHVIAFDSLHNIWVGHVENGISLYQAETGEWSHYTAETSGLGGNRVREIVVRPADASSAESVWFATADGGVSRFEQGEWTVYTVDDGLPDNYVKAIALDKYDRVWVTSLGGVAYLQDQEWVVYDTLDTASIAFGPSCQDCPYDDEHVWTGTVEYGLTHSRLPYPQVAVDITKVCFVSADRERVCPDITALEGTQAISVTYPRPLAPDEKLRLEVVASPRPPYQFREDRGDFLSNLGDAENLFGTWPRIPVRGTIEPGQPFTFTDYDNPITAPALADGEQEGAFTVRWRVWMHTRYAGPVIHMNFSVARQ